MDVKIAKQTRNVIMNLHLKKFTSAGFIECRLLQIRIKVSAIRINWSLFSGVSCFFSFLCLFFSSSRFGFGIFHDLYYLSLIVSPLSRQLYFGISMYKTVSVSDSVKDQDSFFC